MPSYKFIQVDVFTDQPFAGNPLAVFPEAEGLTDEEMAKIAREMNLLRACSCLSLQISCYRRSKPGRSSVQKWAEGVAAPLADLHTGARNPFCGSSHCWHLERAGA